MSFPGSFIGINTVEKPLSYQDDQKVVVMTIVQYRMFLLHETF